MVRRPVAHHPSGVSVAAASESSLQERGGSPSHRHQDRGRSSLIDQCEEHVDSYDNNGRIRHATTAVVESRGQAGPRGGCISSDSVG
jgi:hypothetical protein